LSTLVLIDHIRKVSSFSVVNLHILPKISSDFEVGDAC